MYQQLLLVLDAEEACNTLSTDALNLSQQLGASLHVLVLAPKHYESASHHHAEYSVIEFASGKARSACLASELLLAVQAQGKQAGITVSGGIASGVSATRAVLQAAQAVPSDAIVMSARLRPSLPDLWLGSVAQRVARKLSKPVILLTPADHDDYGRIAGPGLGFL